MGRLQFLKALNFRFFQKYGLVFKELAAKRLNICLKWPKSDPKSKIWYGQTLVPLLAMAQTFCLLTSAQAQTSGLVEGRHGERVTLEAALSGLRPGTVVLMGEQHAFKTHQNQQLQILKKAQERGHLVSVGMEFFSYPDQVFVERWQQGLTAEGDFLKQIQWSGFSFDFYRAQVQIPRWGHEYVVALNAPRVLTGKVAKKGLESLTNEERAQLPPNFQVGNDRYFERFKVNIGHVPDPAALKNYFAAQSIWDDTMAWNAAEFLRQHPEQCLFIIVGEFHVQYGGGLPDRLRARGIQNIQAFSLLNLEGMTAQEELEAIQPSPLDGPRADFLWVSRPEKTEPNRAPSTEQRSRRGLVFAKELGF